MTPDSDELFNMPDKVRAKTFDELLAEPHKKWYEFGPKAPSVLWSRLSSQHPWLHPHREIRYGMQRWRRGWSDRDLWGFDHYLAALIASGVHEMREIAHGYPDGVTFEEWQQILAEIEEGMNAALTILNEFKTDQDPEWAAYQRSMDHLKEWFFALWD